MGFNVYQKIDLWARLWLIFSLAFLFSALLLFPSVRQEFSWFESNPILVYVLFIVSLSLLLFSIFKLKSLKIGLE
ncbi:hypothetical protein AUJ84_03505 [Candidatus Pacearchaeota archaeon CG1_02_32_132]|nr:MAG: hypothetical protein AUJ84_03505 [Candidatus Pacearchaeota archaeon CG1_02_32_132]